MAKVFEPSEDELKDWAEWLKEHSVVREVAEKFPPWELFRLKSTGHRARVSAYFEDGTVQVAITGEYNLIAFARNVFGINPDDLEPCDLPAPGEKLGVTMTPEEQLAYTNARRIENGLEPVASLEELKR